MKSRIKILLIVLGSFVYQSQILAQTPNYTGTWVLNLEKSTLEHPPEGLTSTVFIIKQEGDKFCLTIYHVFGDKKRKISFKMIADGKGHGGIVPEKIMSNLIFNKKIRQ